MEKYTYKKNLGGSKPITNTTVNVDSLSFTKTVNYPSKDTVQIDVAMTGVAQSGGQVVTRALRSAVSRASAVTFDSDLIPGSDNSYQVGNTSYRWQNANFSGDISVGGQVDAGQLCISGDCKSAWSSSGVTGSGTANYIAKWSGSTVLSTSTIYDNGTSVGIGTTTPSASYLLDVNGAIRMSGAGLYNSAGYEIIEGDKTDWLRINNGSSYSSGVAAYDDWAFGTGGLSVGAWGTVGSGNIVAAGTVAVGTATAAKERLEVNGNIKLLGANATVDGYDLSDYGPYWVLGSGNSGQVWKSDGSGRGYWGTDESGSGGITGSGVSGYVPKWSGSSNLGYTNIYEISYGSAYGIGTTSGSSELNVNGAGPNNAAIYGENDYTLGGYGVYGDATYGSGGSGIYGKGTYGVEGNGSSYDFYASGSGTNYGPFTGAHDILINSNELGNFKKGMIVSSTGETQLRYDNNGNISISSTLPKIKLSSSVNDSNVLGAFIKTQEPKYDFWYKLSENERLGIVNALGEGRALVTNINGDINSGDYITTSNIPGYGQKQNDDLLHSYTLGKAIENVDWDSIKEIVNYNGKEYKYYLIGVIYVSG